ncbi:MAG: hypothetical protein JST10_00435 [Bacteroidetes bacterium]|nr:hypothetical protein [Bacteroidota bacterium]MBS1631017.1 hypothetical protein [Bacteroidota bacterium]
MTLSSYANSDAVLDDQYYEKNYQLEKSVLILWIIDKKTSCTGQDAILKVTHMAFLKEYCLMPELVAIYNHEKLIHNPVLNSL